MPKTSKIENDRRLFTIQGWIVDGVQPALIVRQIVTQGWCEKRQAERLLQQARKLWIEIADGDIEEQRKLKVVELEQLKRSLKENWKGSPGAIMAIVQVEKLIIELKGLKPAQQHVIKGDKENPVAHDHKVTVEVVHTGVPIARSEEQVHV